MSGIILIYILLIHYHLQVIHAGCPFASLVSRFDFSGDWLLNFSQAVPASAFLLNSVYFPENTENSVYNKDAQDPDTLRPNHSYWLHMCQHPKHNKVYFGISSANNSRITYVKASPKGLNAELPEHHLHSMAMDMYQTTYRSTASVGDISHDPTAVADLTEMKGIGFGDYTSSKSALAGTIYGSPFFWGSNLSAPFHIAMDSQSKRFIYRDERYTAVVTKLSSKPTRGLFSCAIPFQYEDVKDHNTQLVFTQNKKRRERVRKLRKQLMEQGSNFFYQRG
ncbi:hypothetical protein RFI_10608 [Reticulomyxa filosa]|uniref:Uncharacterized protein n=1 Tax=Reticulomyxa filosa TaxID=46433 RepID=X6NKT8_RETFI|nr:hypothetical protein RFI_10608 [Reticulomyxa filosa]|eukprot:ETO26528.1 hypothetical protein RFI_10608 [Reticulomyxa filosa]